jgi:hypothetical protein
MRVPDEADTDEEETEMENTQRRDSRLMSKLYRTRFHASRNGVTVINLSILFMLISLITAPWLVLLGALAALIMGYRFSIQRDGPGFEQNFDDVVRGAATNVKHAVEAVTEKR